LIQVIRAAFFPEIFSREAWILLKVRPIIEAARLSLSARERGLSPGVRIRVRVGVDMSAILSTPVSG